MRGKSYILHIDDYPDRNNPAYAGKSWQTPWCAFPCTEQPRACGERRTAMGSPPLSWEQPRVCGENRSEYLPTCPAGEQPRECGERMSRHSSGSMRGGSTPCTRGKVGPRFYRVGLSKEQPRVCREKLLRGGHTMRPRGTTPRVRGIDSENHSWPCYEEQPRVRGEN